MLKEPLMEMFSHIHTPLATQKKKEMVWKEITEQWAPHTHIWHTRKVTQASVTFSFTSIDDDVIHPPSCPIHWDWVMWYQEQNKKHIKRMKNNTKWKVSPSHLPSPRALRPRLLPSANKFCWIPLNVRVASFSMWTTGEQRACENWRIFVCTTSILCDVMHLSLCWSAHEPKTRMLRNVKNPQQDVIWRRHGNRPFILAVGVVRPPSHHRQHIHPLTSNRNRDWVLLHILRLRRRFVLCRHISVRMGPKA